MNRFFILMAAVVVSCSAHILSAQGTAFSYQGRLSDSGSPANGYYDLRFAICNAPTNGVILGMPITNTSVLTSNGLFNTVLDFGPDVFTGHPCWLEIGVRPVGGTNFSILFPRQAILPAPYAIFSATSSNLLGTLPTAQLTGTVPSSLIVGPYSSPVNFSNPTNQFAGTFAGNGSGLNSLNASQLASGTVPDARLSGNIAMLNASQTFSGVNVFTNPGNSFSGSFFGNGLVGWIPVEASSIQAEINHGYLLLSPQITSVALPTDASLGYIVRISGAGQGGWRVSQATNQFVTGNFFSLKNSLWTVATVGGSGTWRCMAASADGMRMYAGMLSGGVYSSIDSGQNWSSTSASGQQWYGLACSADGTRVYGVPSGGNIQYSTNAGINWLAVGSSARQWRAVAASVDGNRVIAAAQSDKLYISTNAAASWSANGPGNFNWNSVASSSDGNIFAATVYGGNIYVSTNGGLNWAGNAPAALWSAVRISSDGSRLVATVFGDGIFTSTNSGQSWVRSSAPTAYWNCLASSADCSRMVAGVSNGVLYASVNFGTTWTAVGASTNQPWSALASSADGQILAAAANQTGGNIYYSRSATQVTSQVGTNGSISGSHGSAVELQHIGSGRFMPVSSAGTIWAN